MITVKQKGQTMKAKMIKKAIPAVLLGAVSMGASHGMEIARVGVNSSIHHVGGHIHKAIQGNKPINSVHCALGVNNTLTLLHTISENRIQKEIESFCGDSEVGKNIADLNAQFKANSQPYVPVNKYDKKNFDFTNGVYALISKDLSPNTENQSKLEVLGAQLIPVDFNNADQSADQINGIVAADTHQKITEILSAEAITPDSVFLLLHTLYINASWKGHFEVESMNFTSLSSQNKMVKSLGFEAGRLSFEQKNDVTFISIPTVRDCTLLIRHSATPQNLQPVTETDIERLKGIAEQYVRSFSAPFLSMKQTLNLKSLLKEHLPQLLQGPFKTTLTSPQIRVADYIQKVTFDMTDKGLEASAATAMMCMTESMREIEDGPVIIVNSPFTFALSRTMNGKDYLLFQGQVVDHEVMEVRS